MHTCSKLLYSFPFGSYSSYAKIAELKRRSMSNNSLRKAKDPDLVRLSTRSPGRVGMPAKIPAAEAGAAAGGLCGGRGGCGREEGDGREEGAAAPFEALRALLSVAGDDDVALVLWRLLLKLSKKVSMEGRSQIESVLSAHTMEKGRLLLGRRVSAGKVRVMEGVMP